MKVQTILITTALVLGLSGATIGAELYPPMFDRDGFGITVVTCSILNVGKKDRDVIIEIFESGASSSITSPTITLAPGEGVCSGYV